MDEVRLTVNGRAHVLAGLSPHLTLLPWLRSVGLTAAKEGCAEGECGACAVLIARPDQPGGGGTDGSAGTRWEAVNACLLTVAALNGQEIVTAEGLGNSAQLHPAQSELAGRGGSQCGYCTPGFVVSLAGEYYRPGRAAGEFDAHALSGNLCRCTGYRPIRDAAQALAVQSPASQSLDTQAPEDPWHRRLAEPAPLPLPTQVRSGGAEFHRPATLAQALEHLAAHPEARVLAGGTDWNVEVNLRHARPPYTVAVGGLPELRALVWAEGNGAGEEAGAYAELGAALTLGEIGRWLGGRIPLLDQLLPQFASPLIRHAATLGGNLGTASPIGDAAPALLALGARLRLASLEGEREVALSDFFTGYRQTLLRPGELIRSVRVPLPLAGRTAFYKVAKRRADDISAVAVALALDIQGGLVRGARIGLGGVAATPLRARSTEETLTGQPWNAQTVRRAAALLGREGTPLSDVRASAAYRAAMLEQSLYRFYEDSLQEVQA